MRITASGAMPTGTYTYSDMDDLIRVCVPHMWCSRAFLKTRPAPI